MVTHRVLETSRGLHCNCKAGFDGGRDEAERGSAEGSLTFEESEEEGEGSWVSLPKSCILEMSIDWEICRCGAWCAIRWVNSLTSNASK